MPLPIRPALAKAQEARPGEDVFGEARAKLARQFSERGWLTEKGDFHSEGNLAW